jgi:hypothetical protein
MLLLNDMLRQQLSITNQFLDSQKRLYGSLMKSLYDAEGSMQTEDYTTMAEYKQVGGTVDCDARAKQHYDCIKRRCSSHFCSSKCCVVTS